MLNSMTASEYYYGVTFDAWENLTYFDAIKKRRDLARDLYYKLYEEQNKSKTELSFEKRKRLWKVEKAFKDNQKLLDEKDGII